MKKLIYRFINGRIGTILCSPFIREPIQSDGLCFRTGGRARVDTLGKLQIRLGRYEWHERMLVREFFRSDVDAIDLGASLGIVSCEILRVLKMRKLVSVEADPQLCAIAEENIRVNFPNNGNAEVINAAVTEDSRGGSFVQFGRPISSNLGGHVLGTLKGHSSIISVPRLAISEVVSRLNGARFQMACDIEGSEIPLFMHSADAFDRCELMMVELHHSSYKGVERTPEQVEAMITNNLRMRKIHQVGTVCIFSRGDNRGSIA